MCISHIDRQLSKNSVEFYRRGNYSYYALAFQARRVGSLDINFQLYIYEFHKIKKKIRC